MIDDFAISADSTAVRLRFYDAGVALGPIELPRRLFDKFMEHARRVQKRLDQADTMAVEQRERAARQAWIDEQDGTALSRRLEADFSAAPSNVPPHELRVIARFWADEQIVEHATAGGFDSTAAGPREKLAEACRLFRGRLQGLNLKSRYLPKL